MNIWLLDHYASTPDQQMTGSYDLFRKLVERGHKVTIFSSSFSHYKFVELRLKNGESWRGENVGGVRFIWLRTFPYNKNNWRRVINMVSYAWRSLIVGIKLKERPDIIIGVCVHPLAGLSAYILSRIKNSRFFYEVKDLWPLTLIEFDRLSADSPVAWGLVVLEKFLYKKAEKIIMVCRDAQDYVSSLGISPFKVVWIPNGLDLTRYVNLKPYSGGGGNNFIIMYLGGHVRANAIDVILNAAKILQDVGRVDIKFVFVGDGQEKLSLVELAQTLGLMNVEFLAAVPKKELYKIMGEADAFVLCLRDLPLYKYGMSLNKLSDYLASGRPVLFSGDSSYNPVDEAKAGFTTPPENPAALAAAIEKLTALPPEERIKMGRNGYDIVKKNHEIGVLSERLEKVLFMDGVV